MKMQWKKLFTCLLSGILLFSLLMAAPANQLSVKAAPAINNANKKACWISFLDIEERLQDKTEKAFRTTVSAMYDNVLAYGMNTVIVHVRAMGDALYPSDYFPWSEYLTSDRRDPGYDPLQIMLELAHAKNLQFEAWLNPYRLSRDNESTVKIGRAHV